MRRLQFPSRRHTGSLAGRHHEGEPDRRLRFHQPRRLAHNRDVHNGGGNLDGDSGGIAGEGGSPGHEHAWEHGRRLATAARGNRDAASPAAHSRPSDGDTGPADAHAGAVTPYECVGDRQRE